MSQPSARLIAYPNRCHGCQACLIACSLTKEGRAVPARARLTIVLNTLSAQQDIHYCRQCRKAACAQACPADAIRHVPAGYWVVDAGACTGCGACVAACAFDAIHLAPSGTAVKCDTCAGDPQCVASCPSEALTWIARGCAAAVPPADEVR